MIPSTGFAHHLKFKPAKRAPMYNNNAFCQTKKYVPEDFNLAYGATVLVSLTHKIPNQASYESMKKYQLHQEEVMKGK